MKLPVVCRYLKYTLDQYVEMDYTVVYFHYGLRSSNKPSIRWLRSAYAEFGRKSATPPLPFTHRHTRMHRHAQTHAHMHRHTRTHAQSHTHACAEKHAHMHSHKNTNTHTCTHTHTCTYTHTETRTFSHTHKLTSLTFGLNSHTKSEFNRSN